MEDDNFVTRKECTLIDERVKETMKGMEARAKLVFENFEDRLGKVEQLTDEIHNLAYSVSELAHSVATMLEKQNEQKKDMDVMSNRVTNIEGRDGEKWRTAAMFVITFSLGILLTFIAFKIGLTPT